MQTVVIQHIICAWPYPCPAIKKLTSTQSECTGRILAFCIHMSVVVLHFKPPFFLKLQYDLGCRLRLSRLSRGTTQYKLSSSKVRMISLWASSKTLRFSACYKWKVIINTSIVLKTKLWASYHVHQFLDFYILPSALGHVRTNHHYVQPIEITDPFATWCITDSLFSSSYLL